MENEMQTVRKVPTLAEAFEMYIRDRKDLRPTTVGSYRQVIKRAGILLDRPLDQIKYSDIKHLYSDLRYESSYKPASIEILNNLLNPIFNFAVRDDILNKNPAQGAFRDVARGSDWKTHHKAAVSVDTQKAFLDFIHDSPTFRRWENFFIVLFGTGIRIGEAIALCWEDINFIEKTIEIKRSLYYQSGKYYEGPPKTEAGFRIIPILPEVARALARENQIAKLTKAPADKNIPGLKGLIFSNSKGGMLYASTVNNAIKNIIKAYNKTYAENPIENFSVHQIRHSFCSRLIEQDVNLKVVQTVMGHSNFETTMNIYAEVSTEKKQIVFDGLEGKIIK